MERVRRGEALVSQIEAGSVPHGLIHRWVGAVFVPDATVADVLAVTRDYDQYPRWFGPTINQVNLLSKAGGEDCFVIRYVRKVLYVTAVIEAEYAARYSQVDATRWYSITRSVRVQDIQGYGQPDERKLPPDDGNGYVWRIYNITKYEQRDNGVYIEEQDIALSRQIPVALRWIVEPAVKRLSRGLLERSLQQTRRAVLSKTGK